VICDRTRYVEKMDGGRNTVRFAQISSYGICNPGSLVSAALLSIGNCTQGSGE
jgi:hypothetical protein